MDKLTVHRRSQLMARVHSRENRSTEMLLVRFLRKNKITGWRRNAHVFGNPDFVFRAIKLALFVDGCFWHGCAKHCRMPLSNRNYWRNKIARNLKRDRVVNQLLREKGWTVIRIWEHELKDEKRVLRKIMPLFSQLG